MAQKANRGEPLVARGSYTPRDKGLVTPAFGFGAQVAEVEVDRANRSRGSQADVDGP